MQNENPRKFIHYISFFLMLVKWKNPRNFPESTSVSRGHSKELHDLIISLETLLVGAKLRHAGREVPWTI